MKTLAVAVAVAMVVLPFICIQESSATFAETQVMKEAVDNHDLAAEQDARYEIPVDPGMMPKNRKKRGFECRFCCDHTFCGVCCTF